MEKEQENGQVELVKTRKEEKRKSLAVTAYILDLSISADRGFHRRIRELQMFYRMDATTQGTLDSLHH